MNLPQALAIPRGVTAAIGSGGKTTLLFVLGQQLHRAGNRVVLCTSTHILPFEGMPCVTGGEAELEAALARCGLVCAGAREAGTGKLIQSEIPFARMAELADYVLVEADGARGKPLKAHAPHEPAVPPEAKRVIFVLGADGVGQSIRDGAHRPQRYAAALGVGEEHLVTPADALRMVDYAGATLLVNKAEAHRAAARKIAQGFAGRAVVASLQSQGRILELWEGGTCLYQAEQTEK